MSGCELVVRVIPRNDEHHSKRKDEIESENPRLSGRVMKNCQHCKSKMQVRQADINRGWGKFCSKSCKAKNQINMKNTIDKNYDRWFFDDCRHPLDLDQ